MGWQDAPIVAPAAKGRWQDAPLIRPAPPGEQFGPPMPPEETSFLGEIARGLQLGTQASGAGMADLAGFPVDMTTLALNAGLTGVDQAAQLFGGNVDFRFDKPVGGSQNIRDSAAAGVEAIGGEDAIIEPGQMTSGERVRYEMGRLGTAAATASGGLGLSDDIARYLPPVLTAPHRAPGSSARVLAGDTAAGIGSGATVGSYDEYAPDWLRERLGPVGDLIAGLVGGIGGSRLVGAGEIENRAPGPGASAGPGGRHPGAAGAGAKPGVADAHRRRAAPAGAEGGR